MTGIWKINEEIKGFIKDWVYTNERKVFLEILIETYVLLILLVLSSSK